MIKQFEEHVAKTFEGESYDRLVAGMAEELGEIVRLPSTWKTQDLIQTKRFS